MNHNRYMTDRINWTDFPETKMKSKWLFFDSLITYNLSAELVFSKYESFRETVLKAVSKK